MDLATALISGRRGRRLLLHVLLVGESEQNWKLRQVVFDAAYRVAKRRGDGIARFGSSAENEAWVSAEQPPSELQPENIAALVGQVELPELTSHILREALDESVGNAMYWQPPDGEDTLFSDPILTKALEPAARHVSDSGIVQEWMNLSTAENQWLIEWRGEGAEHTWHPGLVSAAEQFSQWKHDLNEAEVRSQEDLRGPVENAVSGEWWSNPPGGLFRSFGTFDDQAPIGLYCVEDGFGWREAAVQRVEPMLVKPVFHIEAPEDWVDLCLRYPAEVSASRRGTWFETTGRDGRWVQPDWQAVAEDYDGVHLSLTAYLAAAGELLEVSDEAASLIAGWNPDETYWFTDDVKRHGDFQTWKLEDSGSCDGWVKSSASE